jgi:hypothetical protein
MYMFADGSHITASPMPGTTAGVIGTGTQHVGRSADGTLLYTNSKFDGTDSRGYHTVIQTQQLGAADAHDTSTTQRTTLPNGDIEIQHTVTHHGNPHHTEGSIDSTFQVVPSHESTTAPTLRPGPVEEAQRQMGLPGI